MGRKPMKINSIAVLLYNTVPLQYYFHSSIKAGFPSHIVMHGLCANFTAINFLANEASVSGVKLSLSAFCLGILVCNIVYSTKHVVNVFFLTGILMVITSSFGGDL